MVGARPQDSGACLMAPGHDGSCRPTLPSSVTNPAPAAPFQTGADRRATANLSGAGASAQAATEQIRAAAPRTTAVDEGFKNRFALIEME